MRGVATHHTLRYVNTCEYCGEEFLSKREITKICDKDSCHRKRNAIKQQRRRERRSEGISAASESKEPCQ